MARLVGESRGYIPPSSKTHNVVPVETKGGISRKFMYVRVPAAEAKATKRV